MKLYDRPEVCQTYFFPQPAPPLSETNDAGPVPLTLPDGTSIQGYWSHPLVDAPTLLYLHGNGETISDQLYQWPEWAEGAGTNIFFVDYPGYAGSGGYPTFTSCRQAARAAMDFLQAQNAHVIVGGRSVGSIFAIDLAGTVPELIHGLLLESSVAELVQRLEMRWPAIAVGSGKDIDRDQLVTEVARDFDHQAKLGRLASGCPVLVLHTRMDSLIPSWHGERLAEWVGDRLLRLVLFETGDHNTIQAYNGDEYRRHLAELVAGIG